MTEPQPAQPQEKQAPQSGAQAINAKLMYEIVADAMPLEGRDYTIDVVQKDGGTRLMITPLTAIGKTFVPIIVSRLSSPMGQSGVIVEGAGVAAQEVVTVKSLRAKVEAEAAAARKAKIRDAEADAKARYEASQIARRERVTRNGATSPATQEELAAERELKKATELLDRLRRIDARVDKLRVAVDNAARAAADNDAKAGKSWAVDMNAPLTSQFDRQDVIAKLSEKEKLIAGMAEHAVDEDYLGRRAVNIAKQYIIPKK